METPKQELFRFVPITEALPRLKPDAIYACARENNYEDMGSYKGSSLLSHVGMCTHILLPVSDESEQTKQGSKLDLKKAGEMFDKILNGLTKEDFENWLIEDAKRYPVKAESEQQEKKPEWYCECGFAGKYLELKHADNEHGDYTYSCPKCNDVLESNGKYYGLAAPLSKKDDKVSAEINFYCQLMFNDARLRIYDSFEDYLKDYPIPFVEPLSKLGDNEGGKEISAFIHWAIYQMGYEFLNDDRWKRTEMDFTVKYYSTAELLTQFNRKDK